jgi:hypothetical protein
MSYADDLDVLGHASLLHLLGSASTPAGQATLRRWLLTPAAPEVARERQAAVAELAPEVDFRDELAVNGRYVAASQNTYEQFLRWAESEQWLSARPWMIWLSRILPALTVGLLVAQLAGLVGFPYWLLGIVANLLVTRLTGKQVEGILTQVSDRQRVFGPYGVLFALVTGRPFTAPALCHLQARLTSSSLRADAEMRSLGRIVDFAHVRRSMLGPVIQVFLLWNLHSLWLLEGWQRRAGKQAREWLVALGELEALAALATLSYDHPDWAFPELVEDGERVLSARALGHPLLPEGICVRNDVAIGPPGMFLLVTGSNMSGKSTLLRAVGLNVVLAQAGGPACAASLRLPPVALATSIRVRDSLEEGVSYFMAELRRLKAVVDEAGRVRDEGERTLLFLLDEILHGTNTGERQIAARRVIRHLLALGATGAVSTHDLTLADAPQLAAISTPVHFTEQFTRGADGPAMRFDYTLRPGIATSTNALKLMEIVGLPAEGD